MRLNLIQGRFKEPSTWAALAVLAGLFGVPVAPDQIQVIVQGASALFAVLGVILPERAGRRDD